MLQSDEKFMKYMPNPTTENKVPDRAYFWNVANTVQNIYVQEIIKHANE